jgi:transposase
MGFYEMGHETDRLRYLTSYFRRNDYNTLMKLISPKLTDPASFRLHVLDHYYKYGWKSASDAFGVPKSTLYDWKKVFEESGKKPFSLVPRSTRPHHTRVMTTDYRLVEFIKVMRKEYGNVGKDIIKPFLDEYAKDIGIQSIGKTTIGKIIKRRGFTFERRVKYRKKTKYSKLRTRKSPKVTLPGFIQMDSIVLYVNRKRHLFMSVIDIYTKYALVVKVSSLSSANAKKVFIRFQKENPTSIHTVQTDNGSEFLAYFHRYMEEEKIIHKFIYPRLCRVNGVVERFNRTIQEECIKRSDEIYYNEQAFERKLTKYLYWYNYKRPHYALGYMSPIQFINSSIPKSG